MALIWALFEINLKSGWRIARLDVYLGEMEMMELMDFELPEIV